MRTSRILMLSLAMGGALMLAACGSDSTSSGAGSATTSASAGAATTAASSGGADPYGPPATTAATSATTSAASATTAAPAGGGTALAVGQANGKSVLVDGQGLALYLYMKDTDGKSVCNGGCASAWPPLVSDSATPSLGAGLDAEDVTVVTRDDGTKQLAFYGHPLYHFKGDTAAGETNGQGSGGIWFLVDTEGNAVK